jgi:hypothetical protein
MLNLLKCPRFTILSSGIEAPTVISANDIYRNHPSAAPA